MSSDDAEHGLQFLSLGDAPPAPHDYILLSQLPLSIRAQHACAKAGVLTVGDLRRLRGPAGRLGAHALRTLRGVGATTAAEIEAILLRFQSVRDHILGVQAAVLELERCQPADGSALTDAEREILAGCMASLHAIMK